MERLEQLSAQRQREQSSNILLEGYAVRKFLEKGNRLCLITTAPGQHPPKTRAETERILVTHLNSLSDFMPDGRMSVDLGILDMRVIDDLSTINLTQDGGEVWRLAPRVFKLFKESTTHYVELLRSGNDKDESARKTIEDFMKQVGEI